MGRNKPGTLKKGSPGGEIRAASAEVWRRRRRRESQEMPLARIQFKLEGGALAM